MTDIFIFNGGAYKRQLYGRSHPQDDGQYRAPLSCAEAQFVLHDPELPGRDYPGAYASTFVMAQHIDRAKADGGIRDVVAGDYIYFHLIPNLSILTSLAIMTDFGLDGFGAQFEIVDVCSVYEALRCGKTGADVASLIPAITYDFRNGIGMAVKDAVNEAELGCKLGDNVTWRDFRNPDAISITVFDKPLIIRGAAYVRMKVTEAPTTWDNPCTSCNEICNVPRLQLSLTGAIHALRTHEVVPPCNCPEKICAGCESSCAEPACV